MGLLLATFGALEVRHWGCHHRGKASKYPIGGFLTILISMNMIPLPFTGTLGI